MLSRSHPIRGTVDCIPLVAVGKKWLRAQMPVGTFEFVRLFWVICTTRVFGLRDRLMRVRRSFFSVYAALALVAAVGFGGGPAKSGRDDIQVDDAWVRESPLGGNSGGGYMRIVNNGKEADRLLSATSPVAKSIVLKQMSYVGDTLQTRELPKGIEIAAGETVLMRWEAYHLLFVGLKEPFKRDGTFEAVLNFEKAGEVTVKFGVRPRVYW